MHILYAPNDAGAPEWIAALTKAVPDATVSVWDPDGPSVGADVAVVWGPPKNLFTREPGLKVVFTRGAGVDSVLALPDQSPSVRIVRLEDAGMGVQMAEYVVHELVHASRAFGKLAVAQAEREWLSLPPTERRDWPVGVLGLGQLGTRVAQVVASLGYPVAGWSRSAREIDGVECFSGQASLNAFLARTRVLVNVLPLTPETENILCRETLSRLWPDAYLINVARGHHLVDQDLLDLLDAGYLAGASLDAFRVEPLPVDHPFWTHPKIRITPHSAAMTLRDESIVQIAEKLAALSRGEAVGGTVDRSRGY